MDVPCITAEPAANEPHTHTVVFLHGRGDNARSFMSSLAMWRDTRRRTLADALPSFRWVFPQAPMRRCAAPSPQGRLTMMPQWFDVWNTADFAEREELQAEGLRESVPAIQRILAAEAALLGGRWDRVVLAGISMGGATGVHTLFNLDGVLGAMEAAPPRLGAFIGFSCRCPFSGRTLAEMRHVLSLGVADGEGNDDGKNNGSGSVPAANHSNILANTPILLEHCVDDPLVLVEHGRALRDTLHGFGARILEWKEYPSGGHWFHAPAGLDDMLDFLERHMRE